MDTNKEISETEDAKYKDDAYKTFEKFIRNELYIELTKPEGYRFIIGESPYPTASNVIQPYPNGTYQKENIPEVAFLSSDWTIDAILICGILFGSIEKATKFLDWIIPQGKSQISLFGEFLFKECKILIINRYDLIAKKRYRNRDKMVRYLINKYTPAKILVVGKKTTKRFQKMVQHISIDVVHPTYANAYYHSSDWLNTYFLDSKVSSGGSLLKDFQI